MIRHITVPGVLILLAISSVVQAQQDTRLASWAEVLDVRVAQQYADPVHRSFDFWIGDWDVNWRAQNPGEFHHQKVGSWTRNRVFPILGGKAVMEITWDRDKPDQASQRGMSIRYFDEDKQRWVMAQHWPSASGAGWAMLDQLIGDEHHGRISVYSTQMRTGPDGEPRLEHRRYNFADIRPRLSFRWDGSNTRDHGQTWNTWAISEMHRVSDVPDFAAAGGPLPDVRNELLCTSEPHGAFDVLQGRWTGERESQGKTQVATLSAGIALDGCSILTLLESGGARTLTTVAYSDYFSRWFMYQLDDQPQTTHTYYVSPTAGVDAVFDEARQLRIEDEFTRFVTDEKLAQSDALRRIVWDVMSSSNLAWREETRESLDQQWHTATRYRFRRDE